jgi:hypothetical protein
VTIFDYLKDILVTKKGDLPLDGYVPYLVNKWLSFINPTIACSVNSFNIKPLLESKELHYKTMISLFPKMKHVPKINYIKKVKEEKQEEDNLLEKIVAENLELSQREVLMLNALLNELS